MLRRGQSEIDLEGCPLARIDHSEWGWPRLGRVLPAELFESRDSGVVKKINGGSEKGASEPPLCSPQEILECHSPTGVDERWCDTPSPWGIR